MNTRPTLKELASATGMSIATISRALSEPGKVKYSTRLKVEAAKRELQQQSMHDRKGIIGIIVPDISNEFFPLMLEGIESISSSYDNTIMLCNSLGNIKNEENIIWKLMLINDDGNIKNPTVEDPQVPK